MSFPDQAMFQQSWRTLELYITVVCFNLTLSLMTKQQILFTLKMKEDRPKVRRALKN